MADKNIGALLVTSGEQLMGVISERDYTRKVALKGRSSRETKVREIISSPVVSATPDHSVEECMRLMTTNRVISRMHSSTLWSGVADTTGLEMISRTFVSRDDLPFNATLRV